jgi:EAL domain-containing protein (putative c-di-GMP-specific phosphodiesterase class I)/CHASE2 domain-containing sensor protein/GGDEF domain-containing protein
MGNLTQWRALVLAVAGLIAAFACGAPQKIDQALFELRAHAVQRPATKNIVIVAIDPASIQAAGEWPWRRSEYARALEQLRASGAEIIGFDVDFSSRSTDVDDAKFTQSLANDPLSVILPTFVQLDGATRNSTLDGLAENALSASVNIPVDPDGNVRAYFRRSAVDTGEVALIAAALAADPQSGAPRFRIDYGIRAGEIPVISFKDAARGSFDPALVRGKAVLIGSVANELGDFFATPMGPTTPGVLIHALAFESMRRGRALNPSSDLATAFGALLALAAFWPRRRIARLDVAGLRSVGAAIAIVGATILVQWAAPISLDVGGALIALALCFWVVVQREISARGRDATQSREAALRQAALKDFETGCPNRRAACETIAALPIQRGARCVVAIGIERYETLSEAVGPDCAQDAVARFGVALEQAFPGCHGYLLAPSVIGMLLDDGAELDRAAMVVERCAGAIDIGSRDLRLDVSVGASAATPAAPSVDMVGEAEIALDQARRDRVSVSQFNTRMREAQNRRVRLMSAMREGLAQGEFSRVYQPKIDLRSGRLAGLESLLRWDHAELGPISPGEFIVLAEESGSIGMLTAFVLREAVAEQDRLAACGLETSIAVNVSGRSITDPSFVADFIGALKNSKGGLTVEVTETTLIADPALAMAAIAELRAAGAEISIDDYGAGLSSLSYLKQIDAHELKLDKAIVGDIAHSARDRLIVKSTIELAHGLKMRVIAEGVEDPETLAALRAMGCDAAQGYHFARPMGPASVLDWTRKNADLIAGPLTIEPGASAAA